MCALWVPRGETVKPSRRQPSAALSRFLAMTTAWSTPMTFFSATRVPSTVLARIAKPALAAQLAGRAGAAAISPVVPMLALAHVAGVGLLQHDPHQFIASDVVGQ